MFVGAGPGAPDLVTVRGARIIAKADIIIWASSLVHPDLLAERRPEAVVVDSAAASLEDLVPYLERARDEGLLIAKVHTGDPALYGATAEQRELCQRVGLTYESLPGVSAYSAAAARMEAELTVPEVSQSLVVTRLEGGRTPMPQGETVRSFAAHGTTMALYLSVARGDVLQRELLAGGYPPSTPCVVGYRVTWPDELIVRCRLEELAAILTAHELRQHTVVLVGPALSQDPLVARSHLYHPGFAHQYRDATPQAQATLKAEGAVGLTRREGQS